VIKIFNFGSKIPRAMVEYASPAMCATFSFHIFFLAKLSPFAAISLCDFKEMLFSQFFIPLPSPVILNRFLRSGSNRFAVPLAANPPNTSQLRNPK